MSQFLQLRLIKWKGLMRLANFVLASLAECWKWLNLANFSHL